MLNELDEEKQKEEKNIVCRQEIAWITVVVHTYEHAHTHTVDIESDGS